ncbi:MAG: T9SS type A sorting domain-containing protein [Bacteroidota bacterium]
MRNLRAGLFWVLAAAGTLRAQTYDLQFVEEQNTGAIFDVKIQVKSNGSTFKAGSGNLVFTYDTTVVRLDSLLSAYNFSGVFYTPMTVTQPVAGRVSVNIELQLNNFGTTVPLTYLDVATIRFGILNGAGSPYLRWRTVSPNATNLFRDDNATLVAAGTLHNFDDPLPVQLAFFTASQAGPGAVRLDWRTLGETNNYGFEVQRALGAPAGFVTLPGSFLPGHGTTTEPHEYAFTDGDVPPGLWHYRLRQTDLDGTVHYSDAVSVETVTGVAGSPLPEAFSLEQNYPNPFNPSTTIRFAVPEEASVRLEVFNLLGERLAVLLEGIVQPGYHALPFHGEGLSSGTYFLRLTAGQGSFLRKMVLAK